MWLQQYSFDLLHRKGESHVVPDALPRAPIDSISSLSVSEDDLDGGYINFRARIESEPNQFQEWSVKEGVIFRHFPVKAASNKKMFLSGKYQFRKANVHQY
ncbi:hypothetical protein Zmor_003417 [Zophobas morio]|uniref:Uncharacterized protein n=1 Tax=Zophobas morio TaxID=2755281 RepID=A0AA38M1M0_9CUCU|nr:hypothetical protein Zmor_003417 [Zophobas morio]